MAFQKQASHHYDVTTNVYENFSKELTVKKFGFRSTKFCSVSRDLTTFRAATATGREIMPLVLHLVSKAVKMLLAS